jgi:hypothetical protein
LVETRKPDPSDDPAHHEASQNPHGHESKLDRAEFALDSLRNTDRLGHAIHNPNW